MVSNNKEFNIEKIRLRESHSKVENSKAISYSLMALSKSFRPKYEIYKEFLKYFLSKKEKIKILNLGFGAGNIETLLLEAFPNRLSIISIDNSLTFYRQAEKRNRKHIDAGKLKLYKKGILTFNLKERNFDIILSRDLNHHIMNPKRYFSNISKCLSDDGVILMEDLRYDAEDTGIKSFIDEVFKVKDLVNNKWFLYLKIIGLVESFASAYTKDEILQNIIKYHLSAMYFETPARYHFVITKNNSTLSEQEKTKILNRFRGLLNE